MTAVAPSHALRATSALFLLIAAVFLLALSPRRSSLPCPESPATLPLDTLPASPALPDAPLRDELLTRIHHLATLSAPLPDDAPGINRPYLSDEGVLTRAALIRYMSSAGLSARIDAAGNVIGDLSCPHDTNATRRVLALGSHFDSVRAGGPWDGVYGILSAIAVASELALRPGAACSLPFDLRVLAFDDEEGNNPYGTTNFGAKAYVSALDLARDVLDFPALAERYAALFPPFAVRAGESPHEALAARFATAAVAPKQLLAFVELHIEQGPVLERRGKPLAAVDAIAGQTRLKVSMRGDAGHAGTVPMAGRRDALVAAAEAVAVVEAVGLRAAEHSLVATVGVLEVLGGSSNVIPGRVSFTVDVRAPRDAVRRGAVKEIVERVTALAERRGVKVAVEVTHEVAAVSMTPWLREVIEGVVKGVDIEADEAEQRDKWSGACLAAGGAENCSASFERATVGVADEAARPTEGQTLTSGAGHDTQLMARVTDVAMMFVRCKGGLSHHPDEHVSDEDAFEGARALLKVVDVVADKVRAGKVH